MYFGRRNPWASLIGLLILAAAIVYVLWLKPLLYHLSNPVDPSPPEWGSSVEFSNLDGFLQGKWIAHIDESSARNKNKIASFLLSTSNESLVFASGRRFFWNDGPEVVEGKWSDAGGIQFDPETVDGVPTKTALDRLALERSLPIKSPQLNRKWLSEGTAVEMAQKLGPIQLMSDRKRLFCARNIDENGQTFLGTTVRERVKR